MRRGVALLPLLLALGASPAAANSQSDARRALASLIKGVEARRGIQHRSLVVVPLVVRAALPSPGPLVSTAELSWMVRPSRGGVAQVEVTSTAKDGLSTLLPSGAVLRDGDAERLLLHPLLVGPNASAHASMVSLHPSGEETKHTFDVLAPPEYRHVLRARSRDRALHDLLEIQAIVANFAHAHGPTHLGALRAVSAMSKRMQAAKKALRPLGVSYGGATTGHVVFRGNRVIEVVLAGSPATYASYWQYALDGLAHSLVYWESLHDLDKKPVDAVEWLAYEHAANQTMRRISDARLERERMNKNAASGATWRVGPKRPAKTQIGGWFLQSASGRPVVLEVWAAIALNPLRKPKAEPAKTERAKPEIPSVPGSPDRGTGDDSDGDVSGGAMTLEALERLLERLRERRRKIEERKRAGG